MVDLLCRMAYSDGRMNNVEIVAAARPPMTARARGAVSPPLSPSPRAMGIIPKIIAAAVIRMARTRLWPPSTAASLEFFPYLRLNSEKVTNRIAFATATPIAMMAPINDCTFNVVRVKRA